jgi:hypothetical protein
VTAWAGMLAEYGVAMNGEYGAGIANEVVVDR